MSYGLYIYFFYFYFFFFFFNDTATTEIYTLSLHDALPISAAIREQIFHYLARAQDEAGLVVLEIHAERRVEHAVQPARVVVARPLVASDGRAPALHDVDVRDLHLAAQAQEVFGLILQICVEDGDEATARGGDAGL